MAAGLKNCGAILNLKIKPMAVFINNDKMTRTKLGTLGLLGFLLLLLLFYHGAEAAAKAKIVKKASVI